MGHWVPVLVVGLSVLLPTTAAAQEVPPVVAEVVRGMTCTQQTNSTQMDCEYKVGVGLHFVIAGVGQADAGVTFYKVDWDSDYYATFGLLHGCVIVKPGKRILDHLQPGDPSGFSMAFVSPQNGKVYSDWQSCLDVR